MRFPPLYMICPKCNKKVRLNRDRMGDLGSIQNQQLRTYNCPYCGNILVGEINK